MNRRLAAFLTGTALLALLTLAAAQSALSGGGLRAVAALLVLGAPTLLALALLGRAAWIDGRSARDHSEQVSKLKAIRKQAAKDRNPATPRRRRRSRRRGPS